MGCGASSAVSARAAALPVLAAVALAMAGCDVGRSPSSPTPTFTQTGGPGDTGIPGSPTAATIQPPTPTPSPSRPPSTAHLNLTAQAIPVSDGSDGVRLHAVLRNVGSTTYRGAQCVPRGGWQGQVEAPGNATFVLPTQCVAAASGNGSSPEPHDDLAPGEAWTFEAWFNQTLAGRAWHADWWNGQPLRLPAGSYTWAVDVAGLHAGVPFTLGGAADLSADPSNAPGIHLEGHLGSDGGLPRLAATADNTGSRTYTTDSCPLVDVLWRGGAVGLYNSCDPSNGGSGNGFGPGGHAAVAHTWNGTLPSYDAQGNVQPGPWHKASGPIVWEARFQSNDHDTSTGNDFPFTYASLRFLVVPPP